MTYKKPLKRFSGTTLMGESIVAEDTANGKRLGSYAIDAFEAHKTITAEDGDKKILVPFHAVKTAMYGTQTADAEKADAYCGGGTEPSVGEVWFTGTFGECQESFVRTQLTETDKANLDDILANYGDYSVSLNGTELPNATDSSTDTSKTVTFADADNTINVLLDKDDRGVTGNYAFAKCPTDITNVEVTVAKK